MNCNQQTSLKFLETQKQFLSVMFSCGWGIGTSTGSANDGSNDGRPSGSTTVNVVDKGSVKESNTHATIGKGNIEVADGSDIAGVNRDVNKTETVTRDEITGALDATVTVDNRIFTEAGREDIAKDLENLPDNIYGTIDNLALLGVNAGGLGMGVTGMIFNPITGKIEITDDAIRFIGNPLGVQGQQLP